MPSLHLVTCRGHSWSPSMKTGAQTQNLTFQVECPILAVLCIGDTVKESERTQQANNRVSANTGAEKNQTESRRDFCPSSSPFGFHPFSCKFDPILPKQKSSWQNVFFFLLGFQGVGLFGGASSLSQRDAGGEGAERWQFCQAGTLCNDPSSCTGRSPDRQGRESHNNCHKRRKGSSG